MSFRVTQESLSRTSLANINLNFKKLQEIQEKVSTGKRISRSSDDPVGTRKVLGYKTELLKVQQYIDNSKVAKDQIGFVSSALENIQEIFTKIGELGIQASNETVGQEGRNIIASEINEYLKTVLQFANITDSNGRYTFSGTKTSTPAFTATKNSSGTITAVSYNGNNEQVKYQIGPNSFMQVNRPGSDLFINNQVFTTLISMRDELKNSNFNVNTFISLRDSLKTATDNILTELSTFGAKTNRLELLGNRLENTQVSIKELISYNEDADMASLIMDLKNQENVLQSSLQLGARIIQPSLLDFLG